MTDADVLAEFEAAQAILKGHFILSSGKRSDTYLQCARVMMDTMRAERLCAALAARVIAEHGEDAFDLVISPAMGGVLVGYEVARQLKCPTFFAERVEGEFALRRGFSIERKNARCLMVEDVVTTGLSSRECINTIQAHGGVVVGGACLVDRSNGTADIGVPLSALISLTVETYDPEDVPAWLAEIPAIKPGSRNLKT